MAQSKTAATNSKAVKAQKTSINANANSEAVKATEPVNSEAVKAQTESKPKTQRVLETRQDWERIEQAAATLVADVLKGKALDEKCRESFAFKAVKDQPHSRAYAKSLLASFACNKADKFIADLCSKSKREQVAVKVLLQAKLEKSEEKALKVLSEAEKKRCKYFCNLVAELVKA